MGRDWQRAYEEGETPWDKGAPAPPLLSFLRRRHITGRVLVPGCGYGHDVRSLAAQGAAVTGLDIAPGAVRGARAFPRVGSELYREGDFLSLSPDLVQAFDWVFEHTLLCALEPADRSAYVRSVRQALVPGGFYLAIFYRVVPGRDGEGPPHAISEGDMERLFGPHFETLGRWVPLESFRSRPPGSEEVRWMRLRGSGG